MVNVIVLILFLLLLNLLLPVVVVVLDCILVDYILACLQAGMFALEDHKQVSWVALASYRQALFEEVHKKACPKVDNFVLVHCRLVAWVAYMQALVEVVGCKLVPWWLQHKLDWEH